MYYTKADATGQIQSVQYAYDVKNNLTGLTETVGNSTQGYTYQYDDDNRIIKVTLGNTTVNYTYDGFGRLTQKVTTQGETEVKTETYTFVNWTDSDNVARTTSQIATYAVTVGSTTTTYSYTYDLNGNILTISDGTNVTSYVYDAANQLVRENNQGGNYTHTWEYDDAGNIKFRKEYTYTTVESLQDVTPDKTVAYDYNDETWGDLLTSYDSNAITYDGIGNPLTWGNRTFTWERGRQMASLTENGTTWSYTYDASGMRTGRSTTDKTYTYTYNGSRLVQMTVGSNTLRFTYDAAGTPLTVTYKGTTYYYVTNVQGDVVAIVDEDGNEVASYSYDAWGKLLHPEGTATGNDVEAASFLEDLNPLRYRGYVYDTETAQYYLQTRYYDPMVGRFINGDCGVSETGGEILGYNMFVYCLNNPINMADSQGAWPDWIVSAANWVNDNIVQPVKQQVVQPAIQFLENVAEDLRNFDMQNQNAKQVTEANYFSAYKETLVIKVPEMDNSGFSFGAILLGTNVKDEDTVKHEYGHTKQLETLGVGRYTAFVVVPSMICYWNNVPYEIYYSFPWEYGADLYGGVNRFEYNYWDYADEIHQFYWEVISH